MAPIILVNKSRPIEAVEYVKNNLKIGGEIYILGGYSAVPQSIEQTLSDYVVKRLFGPTRYETNLKILKEAGIYGDEILICTGKNYADSICASALGKPILLVDEKLSSLQKEFLSELECRYTIVGGTGAVNNNIELELKEYGKTYRINGKDRYETAVLIAKYFFEKPQLCVLTQSYNFPDGLCGGILANILNAPILLIRSCAETKTRDYIKEKETKSGIVLGGEGAVTQESVDIAFGNLKYTGHNYIATKVEATTAWEGYTLHECSKCGASFITDRTAQLPSSAWPKGYYDETCRITIYREWHYNAWCYIAHLEFSDYSRFGSVLAHDKRGAYETTSSVGKRLGAILCVNGPYNWGELKNAYAIVRSGIVYNDINIHEDLCIYNSATGMLKNAGELGIARKLASTMVSEGLVTDTFKFWNSTIVKNGENVSDSGTSRAQRTFIATNEKPGDIYVIVSEGRYVDGASIGLTLDECAKVVLSLDCTYGVMLDGGGSSTMYFNGIVLNSAKKNERAVVDFVYFK